MGKKKKGGKHGGKHHHGGEKPSPVVESVQCVLKQSFKDEKSVPAHCVHSAKRFHMFFLALVMTCCVKCVGQFRKKRCPVGQQQAVAQPQIVLGQPVVIAATAPAKI